MHIHVFRTLDVWESFIGNFAAVCGWTSCVSDGITESYIIPNICERLKSISFLGRLASLLNPMGIWKRGAIKFPLYIFLTRQGLFNFAI